jgi:CHASE3 domain sensor protein
MKLNIGKKLGVSFGVVVVIMVLAGSFALYQLSKSRAALRNVSEHEMTAALAVCGIRANFDEMVWATKNIILRCTDQETCCKEMERFNYKRNRLETMWQPMLEGVLAGPDITDEQRKFYEDFKTEYTAFLTAWDKALPVYQTQGIEAADAIMKGKGQTADDPLINLMRSLRAQTLKDMEEATARTRTVVIIMLVAFVIAVVIAVIATFYIARQLALAIEGAPQVKRGKKK